MSNDKLRAVARGDESRGGAVTVASFQSFLQKLQPQMAAALPAHLNADRMSRLALTAFSTTPNLAKCDQRSVAGSIIMASQLGLEIGVGGQGWLVPYKVRGEFKCQFIPGWQGLMDLVARAGRASAWTGAVFEGDAFEWQLGDDPFLRHKPAGESDPAKLTHVYAVGRVNGSDYPIIECWPIKRVWQHRDRYNKVGEQHYSFSNREMYARKVVLLQVIKYLPRSIELQRAIEAEAAIDDGQTIDGAGFVFTPEDSATGAGDGGHGDQGGQAGGEPHDAGGNGNAVSGDGADQPGPAGAKKPAGDAQGAPSRNEWIASVNACRSLDDLVAYESMINSFEKDEQPDLVNIAGRRRKELTPK